MIITKKDIFIKIEHYLTHRINLDELVDWAETAMMDADFDDENLELIRNIVGNIGLADVRAFGLTWEDCENYLKQLGYNVKLEFEYA